jgi:voltage-gated potassium channel
VLSAKHSTGIGGKWGASSSAIQAGADRVVLPTRIGAERMAELLLYQNVAKLLSGIQAGDLDRLGRDLRRLGLEIEVVARGERQPERRGDRRRARGLRRRRVSRRRAGPAQWGNLLQPAANLAINEGDGVAIVGRSGRAQIVESVFARPAVS